MLRLLIGPVSPRTAAGIVAIVALYGTSALATDLRETPSSAAIPKVVELPPAPTPNWSGPYLGLDLGLRYDAVDANVFAFLRWSAERKSHLVCVANLSPVPRHGYRVGFPRPGEYAEILNTDAGSYGGSGAGNHGKVYAEAAPWDGQGASALLTLPPLSVVWFAPR